MSDATTISYTGTTETFTVTTTGTYDITAYGAQGGSGVDGGGGIGGLGAEIGGEFVLTAGEVLTIDVGGQGGSVNAGGGGGGTFVTDAGTALVIAGGGGGAWESNGGAGLTGTSGGDGLGYPDQAQGGYGGSDGAGGGVAGNWGGGGGGGFVGAGATAPTNAGGGGAYPSLAGGYPSSNGGAGGFGGGGGSYGGAGGGGGGGGYSGGGGGYYGGGGGGGSLDTGTDQVLVAGENQGNGLVAIDLLCFLAGTLIATPDGERPVEALHIGDPVVTADGAVAPVKWIGHRTLHADGPGGYCHADPLSVMPIRIRAGALGDNLPMRDLLVSTAHALFIDGLLIQAGALVNGLSVVRERRLPKSFTFYHVELAAHALILAEGVPAETFLDGVEALAFDNWREREALYPHGELSREMAYPRIKAQRQLLSRVRLRLIERANSLFAAPHAIAA